MRGQRALALRYNARSTPRACGCLGGQTPTREREGPGDGPGYGTTTRASSMAPRYGPDLGGRVCIIMCNCQLAADEVLFHKPDQQTPDADEA